MKIYLETKRMILREITADDVDLLVELDSDPEVMLYINGGHPTPRATIQNEVIPRYLALYKRYAVYGYWAAIDKSSGEFLGWFFLRPARNGPDPAESGPDDEPVLGYRLRKATWGKGYATEGVLAVVDRGFTEAKRIVAEVFVAHTGSSHVLEKVGMTLQQITPVNITFPGSDLGDAEYAITKAEWDSRG